MPDRSDATDFIRRVTAALEYADFGVWHMPEHPPGMRVSAIRIRNHARTLPPGAADRLRALAAELEALADAVDERGGAHVPTTLPPEMQVFIQNQPPHIRVAIRAGRFRIAEDGTTRALLERIARTAQTDHCRMVATQMSDGIVTISLHELPFGDA